MDNSAVAEAITVDGILYGLQRSQNLHKKISTHLLTVLIIGAIVQLEQRKREIKEKDSDPKVQEHNIFDNQKCSHIWNQKKER